MVNGFEWNTASHLMGQGIGNGMGRIINRNRRQEQRWDLKLEWEWEFVQKKNNMGRVDLELSYFGGTHSIV